MWHYPQKPGLQWILSIISRHSATFQHKTIKKAGTEAEGRNVNPKTCSWRHAQDVHYISRDNAPVHCHWSVDVNSHIKPFPSINNALAEMIRKQIPIRESNIVHTLHEVYIKSIIILISHPHLGTCIYSASIHPDLSWSQGDTTEIARQTHTETCMVLTSLRDCQIKQKTWISK